MPRRRGLAGRLAPGGDFQQSVLAHEGQLLPGYLDDLKFEAVQGPGEPRARGQGRAKLGLIGPALFPEPAFVTQQIILLRLN